MTKHTQNERRQVVLPTVRTSFVQKAAAETALLGSFLVSTLSLTALLFTRSYLQRMYGGDGAFAAVTIYGVLLGAGGVLIILAALVAKVLARNLSDPLLHVTHAVAQLKPGNWGYRRSVHTGDEVEVLDAVADDLAQRLKRVYEHLEEEVRDRTEELKKQYEMDRTILISIQHGMLVVDAEGRVVSVNPAACDMLEVEEQGVLGVNITEVLALKRHHDPITAAEHPVRECLHTRRVVRPGPEARLNVKRRAGPDLPIMLAVSPVLQHRRLIGAVAVFHDITEERRVDYLKSEFISLASHQLRTPLSTIEWYIELFGSEGERAVSKSQQEYLREMSRAAVRMAKLVDALLRAAKLEGGPIMPAHQRVHLREFAEDLGEELRSLAREKNLTCTVHLPSGSVELHTDPILLHIVCQNLFSNAVKYTEKQGRVALKCTVDGRSVTIAVSDTGVGIPRKEHDRIFEKLFRAENVQKMDTDGNGLGLYISQMIMESLGGSVTFESVERKGSTFIVNLPLQASQDPAGSVAENPRKRPRKLKK